MRAEEGDDIIQHLITLEQIWDRINSRLPKATIDSFMTEEQFQIHIVTSLPPSWVAFSEPLLSHTVSDSANLSHEDIDTHTLFNKFILECERREGHSREDIA